MSELIAYLAGIIDGEGSIYIRRNRATGKNPGGAWQPGIGCSMTDKQPPTLLHDTFGGHLNIQYPKSLKGRAQYHWAASCKLACAAIVQLLPYLRVKNGQGELCLQIQGLKKKGGGWQSLTQLELDERHKIWMQCSALNNRGKQRYPMIEWPKIQPRKPRILREVCKHGHPCGYSIVKYKNKTRRRCFTCFQNAQNVFLARRKAASQLQRRKSA